MGANRVMANSTAISKVMGNKVATVATKDTATKATATKATASNMGTVMGNKAMDMASNKVTGTASHKVMVMVATRAMDKVATVATRAMDKVAMVAIKAMAMR